MCRNSINLKYRYTRFFILTKDKSFLKSVKNLGCANTNCRNIVSKRLSWFNWGKKYFYKFLLLITRPRLKVKFYTNNPDWDDVGGKLATEQWYIKNPVCNFIKHAWTWDRFDKGWWWKWRKWRCQKNRSVSRIIIFIICIYNNCIYNERFFNIVAIN